MQEGPHRIDAVVLTMGDRPDALAAAVASIHDQVDAPPCRVLVVWNGVEVADVDAESLALPENLGVTGGRNAGAASGDAEFLLFLDDDAELVSIDLLRRAAEALDAQPALAVVALRIIDQDGQTSRRHVPRVGGGSAARPGPVTAFLGGAVVIRRRAFDEVGGYGELFYAMEETDLSWRLHDAGWSIRYEADLMVRHPRVEPTRHSIAREMTARNRVWIARRNLPWPLAPVYVGTWLVLVALRTLRTRQRPDGLWRGTRAGFGAMPFPRSAMSWRTVWRLTRLGRPPVI